MFSLENKTALVTGAGSGIGAAIAKTFSRAGAFVFVTDRDEQAGGQTVAEIHAAGQKAQFLALDVTSEESCEQTKAKVALEGRPIDVLVNNAGIGHVGTILQTTGSDMDRLYSVNVRGVF